MRYLRASERSIQSRIKAGGDELHPLCGLTVSRVQLKYDRVRLFISHRGYYGERAGVSFLEIICQIRIFDSLAYVFLEEMVERCCKSG